MRCDEGGTCTLVMEKWAESIVNTGMWLDRLHYSITTILMAALSCLLRADLGGFRVILILSA